VGKAGGLRRSHHIRGRAASRFFKAAKHSEGRAQPMNLFVTLNLAHTACSPGLVSQAMGDICAKFGRWLRYQSKKAMRDGRPGYGPPAYEAVLEAPGGIYHVHWLVYVPSELEKLFKATLPKWVKKTAGEILITAGAVHIKPIYKVMALSRYCMKGVERGHARRCHVTPSDQGVILGRRVLISRSLGPTARKKAVAQAAAAPSSAMGKPCAPGSTSRTGSSAVPGPQSAWLPPTVGSGPPSPPF